MYLFVGNNLKMEGCSVEVRGIREEVLGLNGMIISIFGHQGFIQGDSWCLTAKDGCFMEVDPEPVSPDIERRINTVIDDGNGARIYCIAVNKNFAVRLFLEDKINLRRIQEAEITDYLIGFVGISFTAKNGSHGYRVIVCAESRSPFELVDKNGEVI